MVDGSPRTARQGRPFELVRLLDATTEAELDSAWDEFLQAFHKLILFSVRSAEDDYDRVMDRYAYVLEQLREDGFRRLRAYRSEGKAKFSTWLVVVTRRLVVDHRRRQYGRNPGKPGPEDDGREHERRRLIQLVSGAVDVTLLEDAKAKSPDRRLREEELQDALSDAVDKLKPRDQLLLSLRFQDGMSARQISEIMGLPSAFHVYRRLKKVLGGLRQTLTRRGIDGSEA